MKAKIMYRKPSLLRKCLPAFVIIFAGNSISAQSDWQNWNTVEVQAGLGSGVGIKAAHLCSFNITDRFSPVFHQTSLQVSYELNKRWDIQGGVQFITPDSSADTRTRIYARAAHTLRINKKINWTNSIRIETNSKAEYRFRQRVIFTTKLGLRKRLDFLNLAPSVAYSLFYNIGGNPIRYYDKDAQLLARQSPDGLHRSRITFNLNSKINDYLRISLYYMRQQEFNFLSPEIRKMNVYDPVRDRVLRPFNDYNTVGITAQVVLDPFFKK